MENDIYDPLAEYKNVFRDRFRRIAMQTFDELAQEADVDVAANRITCSKIYNRNVDLSFLNSDIYSWKVRSVVLIIVAVAGVLCFFGLYDELDKLCKGLIVLATVVDVAFLFTKVYPKLRNLKTERESLCGEIDVFTNVYPKLRNLKTERESLCGEIDVFTNEAWKQMEPLNRLYGWDMMTRIMSKTIPQLEFDPYFTAQRLAEMREVYDWNDSFNAERSVIYCHSGLINGNPFVLCRTRMMKMGTKTYKGSKTIHWTTRERDSEGKYRTVRHSETLTATVTAPYPEYYERTRLFYCNTAAPDLIFHRRHSGLAGKEDSLSFKMRRALLRNKARRLSNADYAMMTNEEFEVAFDTSDRNNNQQFALLFTPLAQENMLRLLKDDVFGYGDDFDFDKQEMINIITPEHIQELELDMDPEQFRTYEFEKAKRLFCSISEKHFRAIYFSMAPLLCVPMYQQIRPRQEIYGRDTERHSSFWEHEALANYWGQEHFAHPRCVTDCILKTERGHTVNDSSTLTVHAYGYSSIERVTYVKRYGGDGRYHNVPVYWDEYLPVEGLGKIYIKEDNDIEIDSITHKERAAHIDNVLAESVLKLYRRHIASKL